MCDIDSTLNKHSSSCMNEPTGYHYSSNHPSKMKIIVRHLLTVNHCDEFLALRTVVANHLVVVLGFWPGAKSLSAGSSMKYNPLEDC